MRDNFLADGVRYDAMFCANSDYERPSAGTYDEYDVVMVPAEEQQRETLAGQEAEDAQQRVPSPDAAAEQQDEEREEAELQEELKSVQGDEMTLRDELREVESDLDEHNDAPLVAQAVAEEQQHESVQRVTAQDAFDGSALGLLSPPPPPPPWLYHYIDSDGNDILDSDGNAVNVRSPLADLSRRIARFCITYTCSSHANGIAVLVLGWFTSLGHDCSQ
jgi:hypothetical protein